VGGAVSLVLKVLRVQGGLEPQGIERLKEDLPPMHKKSYSVITPEEVREKIVRMGTHPAYGSKYIISERVRLEGVLLSAPTPSRASSTRRAFGYSLRAVAQAGRGNAWKKDRTQRRDRTLSAE
jgi:hypothetical protein